MMSHSLHDDTWPVDQATSTSTTFETKAVGLKVSTHARYTLSCTHNQVYNTKQLKHADGHMAFSGRCSFQSENCKGTTVGIVKFA